MEYTRKHRNTVKVANCARRIPLGRCSFLGPGSEKKWHGTYSDKPDGDWDKTAEQVMLNLAESSHPLFLATSALQNYPKIPGCRRNQTQTNIWKQWKILQNFLLLILTPTQSCRETCCNITKRNFEQLPEDQKLSKLCCDAGLKIVEKGQFFITLDEEEGPNEMKNQCREHTLPRSEEATRVRGWILGNTKIGPVLDVKVLSSSRTLRHWNLDRISVSRRNSFLGSNRERN